MTDSANFDNFTFSTLPNMFESMDPAALQALSSNLMQATQEAQGLISDMMTSGAASPLSSQRPDPMGGLDAKMKIGAALARHPEKAGHAMMTLMQGWMNLFQSMATKSALPRDRRFADPEWTENPAFDFMRRAWQLNSDWLNGLIDSVDGDVDEETKAKARFFANQMTEAMAPTNLLATNPAALRAMMESSGQSVLEGLRNARRDLQRGNGRLSITQTDEDAFRVGENVATAKGQVVFRNKLIEVIHYNPSRKKMRARPMLIFPPWINKFYILDLQPTNSMIRWLLSKRVNTFVVSWRSADAETKDYTWDDYIDQGVYAALKAVTEETGSKDVNAIGYCIGGTLLTSAMAHMAKEDDNRINSATFFASQSDFAQAGELKIFTDETALDHIDDIIDQHGGIMPGEMMGETFSWLRPADLVWRYVVDNYLMGKPPKPFDLLYWNADQTNIPGPVHRTYLKDMYNRNALSRGKFDVFGEPVSMGDITAPIFMQASKSDHICPWHSIYRGAQKYGGEVTFTLAGSGHIAGVINHPDAEKYQHWVNPSLPDNPGKWFSAAEEHPGSWWTSWWEWLKPRCGGKIDAVKPRNHGLGKAPGQYAAIRMRDIAAGIKPNGPYSDEMKPGKLNGKAKSKKPNYRMPAGRQPSVGA
ncbi:MAG: class I poly(R)-hydroxyalkanoic acid synthase [Henriciella sp.]|nr:class I poly(R)-hydroxyalkanoic acid synthase [Henriciella sp.]